MVAYLCHNLSGATWFYYVGMVPVYSVIFNADSDNKLGIMYTEKHSVTDSTGRNKLGMHRIVVSDYSAEYE